MMSDDLVIVACDSVDALTETVSASLTNNNQWVFQLPLSYECLAKTLLSKIPEILIDHVDKIIVSSAAQDTYAKNQTFIEEKIKNKRRVRPSMVLDAMGINVTNLFLESYKNATDIFGVDAACATGLKSIELASMMAQTGDVVLIAGLDKPTAPYFLYYFDSLNALANGGDRYNGPFDANRNGLAMADGAAFIVVCRRDVAIARRLPIIATVNAIKSKSLLSAVTPSEISQLSKFIAHVIEDSRVPIPHLSHWDAHATATPLGDSVEYNIFNELMHLDTPLSSLKGHFGHAMSACGLIELSHSIKNLLSGIVKANGSLHEKMQRDDRIITSDVSTTKRSFIKTSFGFGGRNAVMIVTVEKD